MYLTIAVVMAIALTLVNLLLVMGVVRRLREHSDQLARLLKDGPRPEPMIGPGRRPASFAATTVDRQPVTEAEVSSGGLVGFFSPSCDSCQEWLPRFVDAARSMPSGSDRTLAVVVADDRASASEMVERLRDAAKVVIEPKEGPLAAAFNVTGYPAMCRLDERGAVAKYRPAEVVEVAAGA